MRNPVPGQGSRAGRPIRVLYSVPEDPADGPVNPYVALLQKSLPPDISVTRFSWRAALASGYDAVHLHWPEHLIVGRTGLRTAVKSALSLVWLARLAIGRVPVIRTVHNEAPHRPMARGPALVYRLYERAATRRVYLSRVGAPEDAVVIAHGHYRDWYGAGDTPGGEAVRSARPSLVFFGNLIPYKGIEDLIAAFDGEALGADLVIGGRAVDQEYYRSLAQMAADKPGITVTGDYIEDDALWDRVRGAAAAVLPYKKITNSGAALLALSANTPVLLPDIPMARELRDEFGEDWVFLYQGTLKGEDLARVIAHVRDTGQGVADMAAREWDAIGESHARCYRDAVARRRGGGT
jgi:glycosyltransferase involved in cell wall biosynthesis